MLIVYEGNGEVLVTTPDLEPEMLKLWFADGGREVDDYYRVMSMEKAILIAPKLDIDA